jgi:PAS domain S-box-containing protein
MGISEKNSQKTNQDDNSILKKVIQNQMTEINSFRILTENIPVLVYVYRDSQVIYVNPAVENTLGFTFEEMTQKNFWDICHPDYRDLIRERGQARLQGETVPANYEFKIMKKNGEAIWVDVFFGTTYMNDEMIGIVAANDITEKKLLKEELQAARDELEIRVKQRTEELTSKNNELILLNRNLNNVMMNMSDGVVIVNRSGEFEFLNNVVQQNWGDFLDDIKIKLQEEILQGKNPFFKEMFSRRIPFRDVEFIYGKSGEQIHLLVSGTPIINEQGIVNSGLLMLRPIKDVRKLVNRFSGAKATFNFEDIITGHPAMNELIENAKMAAHSRSNVLIEGESGTGKELFAQAIHNYSRRKKGPFVAINCGAIPRELIGSELFGYAEGAFTGARKGGNPGKFELASGGTIFLDEIGDMPIEQQAVLLRVIQEKSITRIGGTQSIPVDVRIICATNKDLLTEMEYKRFRKDLYYRLNVISIMIPPLRERQEDIRLLTNYFLKDSYAYWEEEKNSLDPAMLASLEAYDWPGNVRELQNVIERMLNTAKGARLSAADLPDDLFPGQLDRNSGRELPALKKPGRSIKEARELSKLLMQEEERLLIIELLQAYEGNVSQVARELGISRTTLYKKMEKYKVDEEGKNN